MVVLLFNEPLPNPPLKQIRGGNKTLWFKALHPFPYCLREGDGGRVQKNKKWNNRTFETPSSEEARLPRRLFTQRSQRIKL
jgi:hypothetical protein